MMDKDFAKKMIGCVEEAKAVKSAIMASTEEQIRESLQEFVNHRWVYCDQLRVQIERIDNIIKTGQMDAAFRAMGAPAVSALGAFNNALVEIFNTMKVLPDDDIDEYRNIGVRACDAQVEFYEAIMFVPA